MSSNARRAQRSDSVPMSFSDLAKTLNTATDGGTGNVKEADRMELLQACENLKRALESPLNATVQILFGVGCNCYHWV